MSYRLRSQTLWEDIAMKVSLLFVTSPAVAALLIALLLCGLSGTAMSQTATPAGVTTSLSSVVIEAPKRVARPQHLTHRAVARSAVSLRTSPIAPTSSGMSPELVKLASATGSCVDGCVTSFRSGDAPWHGCSGSAWPALSLTCRNVGNYKTYEQCREAGLATGWRDTEVPWYCSSLGLK